MLKKLVHPSRFKVPLSADATSTSFTVSTEHAAYINTLRQAYSGTLMMVIIQPPTELKPDTFYEHVIVSGINLSTGVCYTTGITNYAKYLVASGTEICANLIPDGDMEYETAGCWLTGGTGSSVLSYSKSSLAFDGTLSLSVSMLSGTSSDNRRIYNGVPFLEENEFVYSASVRVVSGSTNQVGFIRTGFIGFPASDFGRLEFIGLDYWNTREGCSRFPFLFPGLDLEVGFTTTINNNITNIDNIIVIQNLLRGGGFIGYTDSYLWEYTSSSGTCIVTSDSQEEGVGGFNYVSFSSDNGYISQLANSVANTWYTITGFIKSAAAWYDESYLYRLPITVRAIKTAGDAVDFPIYVDLSLLPSSFHEHVKADGSDIRITKSDGITEVPREIVFYDSGTDTGELHFKGDIFDTTDSIFYIYYGNSLASDYATDDEFGAENVWTNGYQCVYHLQEDPSGNVADSIKDSTSNSYDLTPSGSPTNVAGIIAGNAINFAGVDEFLSNSAQTWYNSNNNITAQWWNYVTTPNLGQNTICWGFSQDGNQRIQSHAPWGNNIYFDFGNYTTDGRTYGAYDLFVDRFTMVHMTSNGATQKRIFLNGEKEYYDDYVADAPIADMVGFAIGKGYNEALYFIGAVDEFRLSTVARDEYWILNEYRNQSDPFSFFYFGAEERVISNSQNFKIQVVGNESSSVYYDSGWKLPTTDYEKISYTFHNNSDIHLTVKVIGEHGGGSIKIDSFSLVPVVEVLETFDADVDISYYYDYAKWYDNPVSSLLVSGHSLLCAGITSGTNLNPDRGSIGLWYCPIKDFDDYTENGVIISGGGVNTNFLRVYYNHSDHKFYGEIYNGTEWVCSGCVSDEQVFVSGTWMHLAFSYDNTIGTKLFIDGKQEGEFYGTWDQQVLPTLMTIGSVSGSYGGRAEGFYDSIVFYTNSINVSDWYQKTVENTDYD